MVSRTLRPAQIVRKCRRSKSATNKYPPPNNEFVYGSPIPKTSGNYFCGDSAGYNTVGDSTLNETFGWADQTDGNSGTRMPQANGSVVFTVHRVGVALTGPINFMQIAPAQPNTACPISTPGFTTNVQGGFLRLPFDMPLTYTFHDGYLVGMTLKGATFGNNNDLTVSITVDNPQNNKTFIAGSVATNTGNPQTIGNFQIGINGFGTLTVVDGHSYNIVDWHVVQ